MSLLGRIRSAVSDLRILVCLVGLVIQVTTGCEPGPARVPDRASLESLLGGKSPATRVPQPGPPQPLAKPHPPEPGAKTIERVVEPGTGTFVRSPPRRGRAIVAADAAGEITLNVVDAELREVVRLVLEETLGVNYVIDPSVSGSITVQTTRPVPAKDLVVVLDAALRLNGAALVQAGDLYKIVPVEVALTSGAMSEVAPSPYADNPGFGLRVVPLRFASAAELAPILEPLVPPGGTIAIDATRNLLLLAGSLDQLATLNDLIATFDVNWLEGMSFGLFPLETAGAVALVEELEQIFGDAEAGPLAGVVRFVPIVRLNAILVVSSQAAYLNQAETWIKRLDRAGDGDEPGIFVYRVENARATTLAEVLSEIFGARAATVAATGLLAPGQEAVDLASSGSFDFGDTEGEQETPSERRGAVERGRSTSTRAGPSGVLGGAREMTASVSEEDEIRIIADDTTNSLVIRATPREYRKIQDALEDLDILPLQVLIEATVLEVTLDDRLRYGVEWFFQSGDFEFEFSPTVFPLSALPGFSAVFASGDDARFLVQALDEITDVNVISSPQLMVLDNQTARIQVGEQVPVSVQSSVSVTDADAPIVSSVELRDTGVILLVTPRVNASGLVVMEIHQEVSNVIESETDTASEELSPTFSQRQIDSTVAIQSGETVVLGGLIEDERERSQSGIPLLSSLPILGVLFGTRSNVSRRTELLVLIRPSVVENPARAREVTAELRRRLRGLEALDTKAP